MKTIKLCLLGAILLLIQEVSYAQSSGNEVIYHVVQRSFYDSNGDQHGDFNGLKSKLDYLQDLGITSLLLLPTCESVYYHNYFSSDFEKLDPRFGTMDEWKSLVKEVHRRKMKIYLDLEFQYVTEDHIWYKDSYGNPQSKYSPYMVYNEPGNQKPEPIIFNLTELMGYDSNRRTIATINMKSPEVRTYFEKLLSYWADPNQDKKFEDGVDGFRLDHMMDVLDGKPKFSGLFESFWNPLLSGLKKKYPHLSNVAEQASWADYGETYFTKGAVDRVFAFNFRNAIASFDKKRISLIADTMFGQTPVGKQQVIFLENHDMVRFATEVKGNRLKMKTAAALNLLIGGVPAIYYGQELGMEGSGGFGKFGVSDGNDIPYREAFEWFKADTGKGMALWYKNTGPWWDQTNLKPNDGISVEEQAGNPSSLLNTYKSLLKLRKMETTLVNGTYAALTNPNEHVFSFRRQSGSDVLIVLVNLSDTEQKTTVELGKNQSFKAQSLSPLYGTEKETITQNQKMEAKLPAYGVEVYKVR